MVKKYLKDKRRTQETFAINEKKLTKELAIVNDIQDKTYLINYYKKETEGYLSEIYMDRYDYTLQEYIYYTGSSLEIIDKVTISQ